MPMLVSAGRRRPINPGSSSLRHRVMGCEYLLEWSRHTTGYPTPKSKEHFYHANEKENLSTSSFYSL